MCNFFIFNKLWQNRYVKFFRISLLYHYRNKDIICKEEKIKCEKNVKSVYNMKKLLTFVLPSVGRGNVERFGLLATTIKNR